jgi:peptidoglycan/xylan/chitin deacetylase (PgdA/CDA1 family)
MKNFYGFINKNLTKLSNQITLYHSNFDVVPNGLKIGIHNVPKNEAFNQILWLNRNYKIVTIDELFELQGKNNYAAITFDDGYNTIEPYLLEFLEQLKIPSTLFICGNMLEGGIFWRDRVRYLMNHNLIENFVEYLESYNSPHQIHIDTKNFYRTTKLSSISSLIVDQLLKQYFVKKKINLTDISKHYISYSTMKNYGGHVSVGNHTFNHYVLSSLTREEQFSEISSNQKILEVIKLNKSNIFSIPFGGEKDFNSDTIEILQNLGYKGALLSRNRIWRGKNPEQFLLDRYMPPETYINFQKNLFKMNLRLLAETRGFEPPKPFRG